MKSRLPWVWGTLVLCAAMVIGAMVWMTRGVIEAERNRRTAESRADLEERTRLALWRMDALGSSIMLRENQMPATIHSGFTPPDPSPEVLLHFEIRKGSDITSAEYRKAPYGVIAERMETLRSLLAANPLPDNGWEQLHKAVIEGENAWQSVPKEAREEKTYQLNQRQTVQSDALRKDEVYQNFSSLSERAQRAKALDKTVEAQKKAAPAPKTAKSKAAGAPAPQASSALDVDTTDAFAAVPIQTSLLRPVWISGELFLLRQMVSSATPGKSVHTAIQGVWIDSGNLRKQLLDEIFDLLPTAKLIPALGERATGDPLTMVSFPFQLDRQEAIQASAQISPWIWFGPPLWVAWAAVALAILSSTLLVRGILRLSERRASFVSAVTHELRTPLTTFRLYSDMLESGVVKPPKQGEYLRILSREADRLSHLVENVLAFSRMERGNARSQVRDMPVGDLLEQFRERLAARLATAGLDLDMDTSARIQVRADTTAVEHILFNLIDNAAKYAAKSSPPVVHIQTRPTRSALEILVTDHGPGIAASERQRIFRAFHKSAREAAESQPGVGLGLALSRRLARDLGGDLTCAPSPATGSCFVLRLPAKCRTQHSTSKESMFGASLIP